MRDIVIIGGGLAGLVSALLLKRAGHDVLLFEKKQYPFHRVCGEYISNEVRDFMDQNNFLPPISLPEINSFGLSSVAGKIGYSHLDLGGFGISRYTLDNHLYQLALAESIEVRTQEAIETCDFADDSYQLKTAKGENLEARVVIGAYGKRSKLDSYFNRPFFVRKSPYIGVKYHAKTNHAAHMVALHNFEGGYCGVNAVDGDVTNICYLSNRDNLKNAGSIPEMEAQVLFRNPEIRRLFEQATFLFDKPVVINEISFETKQPVEHHLLMCGDAAGMITPLCGNGMAMAIHSAKILSEHIEVYFKNKNRAQLEKEYTHSWNGQFKKRLWIGRQVQRLFGNPTLSDFSVRLINNSKTLSQVLIKSTHGKPI